MLISSDEARQLALNYVNSLDLKGFEYRLVSISYEKNWPNEWGVIFDVYTPEGSLMDGPLVLVVECDSGRVRGFEPYQ